MSFCRGLRSDSSNSKRDFKCLLFTFSKPALFILSFLNINKRFISSRFSLVNYNLIKIFHNFWQCYFSHYRVLRTHSYIVLGLSLHKMSSMTSQWLSERQRSWWRVLMQPSAVVNSWRPSVKSDKFPYRPHSQMLLIIQGKYYCL